MVKGKNPVVTAKVLEIVEAILDGETVEPDCPYCDAPGLVFSFTRVESTYGLFIECPACRKWLHTHLLSRPAAFDERYVLPKYQKREEIAVRFAQWVVGQASANGSSSTELEEHE